MSIWNRMNRTNQTENLKITLGHNVFNQPGKETTAQQPEENSQSKDSNSNIFHSIIAQLISIQSLSVYFKWALLYGMLAFHIAICVFIILLMRSRKHGIVEKTTSLSWAIIVTMFVWNHSSSNLSEGGDETEGRSTLDDSSA